MESKKEKQADRQREKERSMCESLITQAGVTELSEWVNGEQRGCWVIMWHFLPRRLDDTPIGPHELSLHQEHFQGDHVTSIAEMRMEVEALSLSCALHQEIRWRQLHSSLEREHSTAGKDSAQTHFCAISLVIEQLGGKQLVMNHMHHEDQQVRYNALLAVQKLMVHNWWVLP
ncbi:hypothetical protein JZ751_000049 [Albula glossodonta]|uniref:ATPase V1 complex subunit H C-terminal domain-containing protein n=1 Tax=Albula glossodonta TaxID=121402 RepID=A0A8T2PV62_9TELE|nr:hypothetical protein JZ751_000049 [Albula glossodonta]